METVLLPLFGGILIGLSTSIVLFSLGRITGISGIFASTMLAPPKKTESWKYFFLIGLVFGGLVMKLTQPNLFQYEINASFLIVILAGLLVGFGTRLGSGCTSGHGVCGLARRSQRSFIATLTFMLFGVITVYIKGLL